jgi:hypothetical protein
MKSYLFKKRGEDFEYPLYYTVITYIVATANFVAFVTQILFLVAILSKKAVRNNPFNTYIIFLILPDAMQTFETGFICTMKGMNEGLMAPLGDPNGVFKTRYRTYMSILIFYWVSNLFLNAVIVYELNVLIAKSYKRIRYRPPTLKRIHKQVAVVYFFGILMVVWINLDVSWSFYDMKSYKFGSPDDGIFGQLGGAITVMSVLMIPVIYAIFIRIRIWKKKLLPKIGRTKVLSLFFMRIIAVFILGYLPSTGLTIASAFIGSPYSYFFFDRIPNLITALEALYTLHMVNYKDDINGAVQELIHRIQTGLRCRFIGDPKTTQPCERTEEDYEASANFQIVPKSKWDESDAYDIPIGDTSGSTKLQLSSHARSAERSDLEGLYSTEMEPIGDELRLSVDEENAVADSSDLKGLNSMEC